MAARRGKAPLDLTVRQEGLQALADALKQEADGKKLRRDLSKGLRQSLDPIKEKAKSNLMAISSAGLSRGQPLRESIAKQMKAEARLGGQNAGARLKVRRRGIPRGFRDAPRALNSPKGWRHPVFGTGGFAQQYARPAEWFDRAAREGHDEARKAAIAAMEETAARIIKNAK